MDYANPSARAVYDAALEVRDLASQLAKKASQIDFQLQRALTAEVEVVRRMMRDDLRRSLESRMLLMPDDPLAKLSMLVQVALEDLPAEREVFAACVRELAALRGSKSCF